MHSALPSTPIFAIIRPLFCGNRGKSGDGRMNRFRSSVELALILLAVAPGCASSPWSASRREAATRKTAAAAQPARTPGTIDAQAMQQILAELRQAGNLDPATQQKFIEDLQQADPSLWPLMLQQFRAQMAYRQRLQHGATPPGSPPQVAGEQQAPATGDPRAVAQTSAPPSAAAPTPPPTTGVVKAVYEPPSDAAWQAHLAAAIRAKEADLQVPGKAEDSQAQAQLRMLYLLAGRRDDALRPIASAPPSQQGFWVAELYGLSTWLDTQRNADETRRAAEAKPHLAEAVNRLGESCPLVVRSLSFCTEIQSFGCVKPFERCEFAPGQAVLLYAEIENLTGEATAKGVHTAMQSSYQIFDGRGQRVADEEFTVTEEYCRNPRRDYFIGYELHVPERVYPGKHTLQLTIRDTQSQKIGQSTIDFTVKKK
jgi:hypothetical protein